MASVDKQRHAKRLTPKSHYEASIYLYRLLTRCEDSELPCLQESYIEVLKLFIIQGLNYCEISRLTSFLPTFDTAMCDVTVRKFIHSCLPSLEYEEPYAKNATTLKTKYRKRLTPESHYEASVILHRILNHDFPDHITWNVPYEHILMLKNFIIEGLNAHEIARLHILKSQKGNYMSSDMISIWLNRYFPNLTYEEKKSNYRRWHDVEELKAYMDYRNNLPKTPCAVCGSTENLELDHIITYAAGGRSTLDNLQWLCHSCHRQKTIKEAREFRWAAKS